MITALTVNYNTPDFLERLVLSFRRYYDIPMIIVDGSDHENYLKIKHLPAEIHHFAFNIHHGPGLSYGFGYIKSSQILVLDSDLIVINSGFVEDLQSKLKPESYGIGDIQIINDRGFNVKNGIKYLHPACMLVNKYVVLRYPLPIKHGAPMIETMKYLHENNLSQLLQHEQWITNDFRNDDKIFISHSWCGTVNRVGGYNL